MSKIDESLRKRILAAQKINESILKELDGSEQKTPIHVTTKDVVVGAGVTVAAKTKGIFSSIKHVFADLAETGATAAKLREERKDLEKQAHEQIDNELTRRHAANHS